MTTTTEQRNMELMTTLDHAWNGQDTKVFRERHKPDVVVYWPGKTEPTVGIDDHTAESIDFWNTFPDQNSRCRTRFSSLRATGPARSPDSPEP